jgi:hypothetical protein
MTPVGPTRVRLTAQSSANSTAVLGLRSLPTLTTSQPTQVVGAIGSATSATSPAATANSKAQRHTSRVSKGRHPRETFTH